MCNQCWLQGFVQISIFTAPEAYTASSLVNFWRWNFHPKFLGSARAESIPLEMVMGQIPVPLVSIK